MLASQRPIIEEFEADLIQDVIPNEMLPYLRCLNEDDREQIRYKQYREGPRAAVPILLDRLKKREGAFKQLLTALGKTGCGHLKKKLHNAVQDQTLEQTHIPEQDLKPMTPESISKFKILKTPTRETASPFTFTETKQSSTSKRRNKKRYKMPKENTSSSPTSHVKLLKNSSKKSRGSPRNAATNPSSKFSQNSQDGPTKETFTDPKPTTTRSHPNLQETDDSESDDYDTLVYDTLVCYAEEDRETALELKEFLENEYSLQVCMDMFNFIPGKPTIDNICDSIRSSRSIVFLLSPQFHRKLLGSCELKNAVFHNYASQSRGKDKMIIPVLLKECQVPDELRIYTPIKIHSSRKKCWKRLAAAMKLQDDATDEEAHHDEEAFQDHANDEETPQDHANDEETPQDHANDEEVLQDHANNEDVPQDHANDKGVSHDHAHDEQLPHDHANDKEVPHDHVKNEEVLQTNTNNAKARQTNANDKNEAPQDHANQNENGNDVHNYPYGVEDKEDINNH